MPSISIKLTWGIFYHIALQVFRVFLQYMLHSIKIYNNLRPLFKAANMNRHGLSKLEFQGNRMIFYLRCFGTMPNTGNQAIVVTENIHSSPEERLLFTQQYKRPACVFMEVSPKTGDIILDYYYPHARSPLCLHATLAASQVYFSQYAEHSKLTVVTSMGQQKIEVEKKHDRIFVEVCEQKIKEPCLEKEFITKMLNIHPDQLIAEPVIRSIGSPKLLCEVSDVATLYALNPNLQAILAWSKEHQINGCYVYCKLNEYDYVGRNFNHLDPAFEDAATGVAAGALTVFIKHDINLYQGEHLNNPCVINTQYFENYIYIGGIVSQEL